MYNLIVSKYTTFLQIQHKYVLFTLNEKVAKLKVLRLKKNKKEKRKKKQKQTEKKRSRYWLDMKNIRVLKEC